MQSRAAGLSAWPCGEDPWDGCSRSSWGARPRALRPAPVPRREPLADYQKWWIEHDHGRPGTRRSSQSRSGHLRGLRAAPPRRPRPRRGHRRSPARRDRARLTLRAGGLTLRAPSPAARSFSARALLRQESNGPDAEQRPPLLLGDAAKGTKRRPLAVVVLAAGKGTRLSAAPARRPRSCVECLGAPAPRARAPRASRRSRPTRPWSSSGHGARGRRGLARRRAGRGAQPVLPGAAERHRPRRPRRARRDAALRRRRARRLRRRPAGASAADLERLLDAPPRARRRRDGPRSGSADRPGRASAASCATQDGRFARDRRGEGRRDRPEVLALREFNTGVYAFDARRRCAPRRRRRSRTTTRRARST